METETQSAAVVSKLIEFLVFVGQDEFQVERGLELSSVILQLEPENALVKKVRHSVSFTRIRF